MVNHDVLMGEGVSDRNGKMPKLDFGKGELQQITRSHQIGGLGGVLSTMNLSPQIT
jgi:hypothetical protein